MVVVLVAAWTIMLVVGVLVMERAAFTQCHRQCSVIVRPDNHCGQVGPHLVTRVPMGTFSRFWVPFFFEGPHLLYFYLH